tara:strand:- start:377 stop:1468 length:1092 start_codon:yes stop_codon:yes gene_type:complete
MFVISTRNFPPDLGGIQNLMEGLAKALTDHGPVKIFADDFKNSENYDKQSKLNIQRITGFKLFKKYRKANLIKDFIKENSVRAIFFDHWKSIEHINSEELKKTVSFCLIHSKEINHAFGSSLNKRMLKALNKSNHIIANSSFTKELASKFGANSNKIKIIHPGCNYPIQINEEAKKEAKQIFKNAFPKIITIARLDKRKSHQNILMSIKNLIPKFPKIKYVSIGNGEEKSNLEKLCKELNLNIEVLLINKSNEQLKVALLEQADLFLMPSVIYKKSVEGFGISFIEAASYGKGSIGGISGGERDAIKDGVTGYLCDGNDINAIYNTILKFFQNDEYKRFGSEALIYSKNFKWKKIVKEYLELI